MTVMEFPGRLIESEQLGAIWVPTATVEIKYRKLSLSCEMLVDTGAYLSMVPYQIGIELGLTISEDEILEAGGVGGVSIPHMVKEVELQIGENSIHTRIGWALTDEVPLLLGRLDVFNEFDIEFSQSRRKTIFRKI
jgi:hypothetical protein